MGRGKGGLKGGGIRARKGRKGRRRESHVLRKIKE